MKYKYSKYLQADHLISMGEGGGLVIAWSTEQIIEFVAKQNKKYISKTKNKKITTDKKYHTLIADIM